MKIYSKSGWILSVGAVVFMLATVLFPCLPVLDPTGDTLFVSRFDFSLALFGNTGALWGQWLGGGDAISFVDRIPVFWRAIVTLCASWGLGLQIVKLDQLESQMTRTVSLAVSFVTGYFVLNGILFLLQEWFRIDHWIWPCAAWTSCFALLWLLRRYHRTPWRWNADQNLIPHSEDLSIDSSWKRRIYGLGWMAVLYLFGIQLLGACIPTVDFEVRRDVWWKLTSKARASTSDATPAWREDAENRQRWLATRSFATIDYASVLWQWETNSIRQPNSQNSLDTNMLSSSTLKHLHSVLPSKVVLTVITWLGFLLVALFVKEQYGKLPAIIVLLLLGSTPSLFELMRLGRQESVYGAAMIVTVIVYRYSVRSRVVPIASWIALSLPLLTWFCSCLWQETEPISLLTESVLRFFGFSSLHAFGFVPMVLIGAIAGSRFERMFTWIPIVVYVVIGLCLGKADRCWVPTLCLLAIPAARGVLTITREQSKWVGIPMWASVLMIAVASGSAWPNIDNRIFASYSNIVNDQWQHRESVIDTGEILVRYPLEMKSQMSKGALGTSPRVLLVGEWDDLDLPMRCIVWLERDPKEFSGALENMSKQGITHVALVSSSDSHSRIISLDSESQIRSQLRKLEIDGRLKPVSVASNCRELSIYELIGP